jgi:hypothetical protein
VKEFMKARGLEAWHGHLTKHLNITTCDEVKAITAVSLRRYVSLTLPTSCPLESTEAY